MFRLKGNISNATSVPMENPIISLPEMGFVVHVHGIGQGIGFALPCTVQK